MLSLSKFFRSTSFSTNSKERPTVRPMLENLEGRTLMAGNIKATLTSNVLSLREEKGQTGLAHAVEINQSADGTIHVEGFATADGTKSLINGAPSRDFHGVQFLDVFFGDGADFVEVGNHGPIALKNVTIGVGNISATSRGPGDDVDVQNLTGNVLAISTGGGDDAVSVRNAHLNFDVNIRTGIGNNNVSVIGANMRELSILLGNGIGGVILENVNSRSSIFLATDASAGGGNNPDAVFLSHVTAGDSIFVNTNGGSDLVRLSNVSAARNLNVSTGAGRDTVNLAHIRANSITVDGGADFDKLTRLDVNFGRHMRTSGFEEVIKFQVDPGLVDNPPIVTLLN